MHPTHNVSTFIQKLESPIGSLYLVSGQEKLWGVIPKLVWPLYEKRFSMATLEETAVLRLTKKQLNEYFDGRRRDFKLPIELHGTEFQKKVWLGLKAIPYGETRSYKDQALAIQSPGAARAVGRVNGLNPLCIILPCHRVIGSSGSLTGYAGGLPAKRYLLDHEARVFRQDDPLLTVKETDLALDQSGTYRNSIELVADQST